MGLLSKLFSKTYVKYVYPGPLASSAPFDRQAYEHDMVRATIDCIASHAAKAEAMHVVVDSNGRIQKVVRNSPYAKLLNQRPNPLMTGFDLKYKLFTQLEAYTTSLCFFKWNGTVPTAIIPINYEDFEIVPIVDGGYAVMFTDYEGEKYTLNIEDVVVLRKFFNTRDVAGDGNKPLYDALDILKAADTGLVQAVTVANKVRGLLKQKKAMLSPADVTKSTDDFVTRFNNAAKNGGIVGVDSMEEYTPLTITPWSANASQMRDIEDRIARYYRTPNPIVMSDYSEAQGQAWFESKIEPLLIQAGQAFTGVAFTQREYDVGNRIIFSHASVMSAGLATKVQLLNATRDSGELTPNERRELIGYPPVEDGDERLVSLNYVKAKDQSKYQTGEDPKEDDGGQNEPDGAAV
jgi:HK97 family phage portal protein